MSQKHRRWIGVGIPALIVVAGAVWLGSLPTAPAVQEAVPPLPQSEQDALTASLKPPKRERPVIAIIGINDATELTDYLLPYGTLRRSGVAEVVAVATKPGPVALYPASFQVEPQATTAEFDTRYGDGADYLIVPAMSRDDDPDALRWIKSQAAKGAIVIGVCAGAKVVAAAGLLEGRRATTHWYYLNELRRKHPAIEYVPDRRIVVDGRVATTTGITASLPMSLCLIEAIAGRQKAAAVGREIGLDHWDARHASRAFQFTRRFALTAIRNRIAGLKHDQLGVELEAGLDEVALALVADAWSRTYRSHAVIYATTPGAREMRNGLRILPARVSDRWPAEQRLLIEQLRPVEALDHALDRISDTYGARSAEFVRMQLEYPK